MGLLDSAALGCPALQNKDFFTHFFRTDQPYFFAKIEVKSNFYVKYLKVLSSFVVYLQ